jgi:hypothetical protein
MGCWYCQGGGSFVGFVSEVVWCDGACENNSYEIVGLVIAVEVGFVLAVSESVEDIRCSDLVVLGSVEGMMDLSFYL